MKKGQSTFSNFVNVALTFIFVGVLLAMGLYVNNQFGTQLNDVSYANESLTFTNDTWTSLKHKASSVSSVANATNEFPSANVTTRDVGEGTQIKLVENQAVLLSEWDVWNVSYYAYNTSTSNVTSATSESMQTFTEWLPIIAVVIAASITIGLLMMALMLRRQ